MPGSITFSSNMAVRGTDIQLGGNLEIILENAETNQASESEKKAITDKHKKDKQIVLSLIHI